MVQKQNMQAFVCGPHVESYQLHKMCSNFSVKLLAIYNAVLIIKRQKSK